MKVNFDFYRLRTATLVVGFVSILIIPLKAQNKNEGLDWIDIKTLEVQGRGWEKEDDVFGRLPAKAEEMVPSSVWGLSKHTSGMYVKFKTNASTLKVKWNLTSKNLSMPHFAATGVSGVDLYVKTKDKEWHWLSVGRPVHFPENEATFFEGVSQEEREYLLYLPLYNGINNLFLGVPSGSYLDKTGSQTEKPIVFYGTSITQGGCASRPGMSATALLGRYLDREIINLGFSGSGRMEPALAHLLAELDPAMFFIDCLPNLKAHEVAERVEPFVKILRENRPETPIVLAEGVTYDDAFFIEKRNQRNLDSRIALRAAFENLLQEGYRNIYYQVGEGQLGQDGEGTVDGTHPTDLGFWRQAQIYQPLIESVLQKTTPTQ
jgi:hypothetical protein